MQIQPFLRRPRCVRCLLLGAVSTALLLVGASGSVAEEIEIAPHRAAYTLELESSSRDSTVADASGGMVYSWGETCDGWTVEQNFILSLAQSDGRAFQLTAISSTWESKDGKRFRFNIRRERNGQEVEKISGSGRMEKEGEPGYASFEQPEDLRITLPAGTVFPTMYTIRLIRRAAEGVRTDRQTVFDGSEVKPPGPVATFILPLRKPKEPNSNLAPLGPNEVRGYNMAFFPATGAATEPEFEMSLEMQDNGVAPSLVLDYGDYSVRGRLVKLEPLEKPDC